MSTEFEHLEDERCERCAEWLSQGEHGVGICPFLPRKAHAVEQDSIEGGMWQENGLPEPMKFYSKKERDRVLAEHGNIIAPRWVENDKHLINWAAGIDAKTLDNARVLLSRASSKPETVPAAPPALIKAFKDRFYR